MRRERVGLFGKIRKGRSKIAEAILRGLDARLPKRTRAQQHNGFSAPCYVEAGASATSDRRPEFQRVMEAGTAKPPAFGIVIVHSFSRFFRDHFELEFHVRKLAKSGVKLMSVTQEPSDDPMHVVMRQIMTLCGGATI